MPTCSAITVTLTLRQAVLAAELFDGCDDSTVEILRIAKGGARRLRTAIRKQSR